MIKLIKQEKTVATVIGKRVSSNRYVTSAGKSDTVNYGVADSVVADGGCVSVSKNSKLRSRGINVDTGHIVVVSQCDNRKPAIVGDRRGIAVDRVIEVQIHPVLNWNQDRRPATEQPLVVLKCDTHILISIGAVASIDENDVTGRALSLGRLQAVERQLG